MNAKWIKLLSTSGAILAAPYTFGEIKSGHATKDIPSADVDLYKLDPETIAAEKNELRSMMELIQKRLDRIQKIEARLEDAKREEAAPKQPVSSGPQAVQLSKKESAKKVTPAENKPVAPKKATPTPPKPVKSERPEVVVAPVPAKAPATVNSEPLVVPAKGAIALPPSAPVTLENLQLSEDAVPTKSFSPVKEPIVPARELKKPELPFPEEVPQAAKEKLEPVKAQTAVLPLPNFEEEAQSDRDGGVSPQDELFQVLAEIRAMASRNDDDFGFDIGEEETSVLGNMALGTSSQFGPTNASVQVQYPREQAPIEVSAPEPRPPLPSFESLRAESTMFREAPDTPSSKSTKPAEKKVSLENVLLDASEKIDSAEEEIDFADADMADFEDMGILVD
ncbi:MAG: hypothetical protein LW808_002310 [Verrucomicrobiota bacterium]|nr:MAG: hypothetical protein LW808_002310 [Verrucomicrobiota bacterium]